MYYHLLALFFGRELFPYIYANMAAESFPAFQIVCSEIIVEFLDDISLDFLRWDFWDGHAAEIFRQGIGGWC